MLVEKVIYGDILAIINFSMDYLALFLTAKIMHVKYNNHAMTFSAVLGAIYSVIIVALSLSSKTSLWSSILFSFVMIYISFGKQSIKSYIKNTAVFYLVSFSLGGGITAICNLLNIWQNSRGVVINGAFDTLYGELPFGLLIFVALICSLFSYISGKIVKNNVKKLSCTVEVIIGKKQSTLSGLVDSGNLLHEPITQRPIVIVTLCSMRSILPPELIKVVKDMQISNSERELDIIQKFTLRFVPTSTVNGSGMLVAILPKQIKINGSIVDAYLAIDAKHSAFDQHQALVPSTLIQ